MKNIILRSISGTVYVALIVCSLLLGGSWGFPLICCAFTVMGMCEFMRMVRLHSCSANMVAACFDLLLGVSIPFGVMMSGVSDGAFTPFHLLALSGILAMARLVTQLYVRRDSDPVAAISMSIAAVAYVALPMGLAVLLYQIAGAYFMLLIFIMIWLNDTGAFLVGSAIGSHRLFARLSPKKSWEGFFGGMAFCVGAAILSVTLWQEYFPQMDLWLSVGLGLIVCVAATWGDLFESMIKRTAGVKDSGNIMPGHGGVLDRIDSLLFVVPFTMFFLIVTLQF